MPAPELDHVQIAAPPGCEPAARHFFADLLGLEELPKPAPLNARGEGRRIEFLATPSRGLHVKAEYRGGLLDLRVVEPHLVDLDQPD